MEKKRRQTSPFIRRIATLPKTKLGSCYQGSITVKHTLNLLIKRISCPCPLLFQPSKLLITPIMQALSAGFKGNIAHFYDKHFGYKSPLTNS